VGSTDDSTAELDGGGSDELATAELAVIGLEDEMIAEDWTEELAGAELSTLDVGVSDDTTKVEVSEVGTSDEEIVEDVSTNVETVSEGTAVSADDAIEDLAELAYVLHRPFFLLEATHEVVESV
jgi:hypothetical protein